MSMTQFEYNGVIIVLLSSHHRRGVVTDWWAPTGSFHFDSLPSASALPGHHRFLAATTSRLFSVDYIHNSDSLRLQHKSYTSCVMVTVRLKTQAMVLKRRYGQVRRICLRRIDQRDAPRSMVIRRGPLQIYVPGTIIKQRGAPPPPHLHPSSSHDSRGMVTFHLQQPSSFQWLCWPVTQFGLQTFIEM